jgi:hypothetical protein
VGEEGEVYYGQWLFLGPPWAAGVAWARGRCGSGILTTIMIKMKTRNL